MGVFTVRAKICGFKSCEEQDMLVDTGSTFSLITPELADRLEVLKAHEWPFETPSGTLKFRTGVAKMEINGREAWVPIAISDKFPLAIGATTLEVLGFEVDPIEGRLKPKPLRI